MDPKRPGRRTHHKVIHNEAPRDPNYVQLPNPDLVYAIAKAEKLSTTGAIEEDNKSSSSSTDISTTTLGYLLLHEVENVHNLVKLLMELGVFSPFYFLERWSPDQIYTQIDHILSMEKQGTRVTSYGALLRKLLLELPRGGERG